MDLTLGQIKQINALRARLVSEKATDTDQQIKALKESFKKKKIVKDLNIDLNVGKPIPSTSSESQSLDITLDSPTEIKPVPARVKSNLPLKDNANIDLINSIKGDNTEVRELMPFTFPSPSIDPNSKLTWDQQFLQESNLKYNFETGELDTASGDFPSYNPEMKNWNVSQMMEKFNEAIKYKSETGLDLINDFGTAFNTDPDGGGFLDYVQQVVFANKGYDWNKFKALEDKKDSLANKTALITEMITQWNDIYDNVYQSSADDLFYKDENTSDYIIKKNIEEFNKKYAAYYPTEGYNSDFVKGSIIGAERIRFPTIRDQGLIINDTFEGYDQEQIDKLTNNPFFSEYFERNPISSKGFTAEGETIRYIGPGSRRPSVPEGNAYRAETRIDEVDGASMQSEYYQNTTLGEAEIELDRISEITTNEVYLEMVDASKDIVLKYEKLMKENVEKDKIKLTEAWDKQAEIFSSLPIVSKILSEERLRTGSGSEPTQENLNYLNTRVNMQFEEIKNNMIAELGEEIVEKIFDGSFIAKDQEEADSVNVFLDEYNKIVQDMSVVNETLEKIGIVGEGFNKLGVVAYGLNVAVNDKDLTTYVGTHTESVTEGLYNGFVKGINNGENNIDFYRTIYGATDDESIDEAVARLVVNQAHSKGLLTTEQMDRYMQATTFQEQTQFLSKNPIEIMTGLFLDSMGQFLSTGLSTESIAPSIAIGVGTGLTKGPTYAGLATGIKNSLMSWQAITAFNMEMGNAMMGEMQKEAKVRGYDLNQFWKNPEQIKELLTDQDVIDRAQGIGIKRGLPIAAMTLVTSAASLRLTKGVALKSQVGRAIVATQVVGVDALGEASGEAIAIGVSGEGNFQTDITNEVLGGFGSSASVASIQITHDFFRNKAGATALELAASTNFAVNSNFDSNRVKAMAVRLLSDGTIDIDTYEAMLENQLVVDQINEGATNATDNKVSRKIKGSGKVRNRLADLYNTLNFLKKFGNKTTLSEASKNIKNIEREIQSILDTGGILEKGNENRFQTINDQIRNVQGALTNASNILNMFGIDSDVIVNQIDSNSKIDINSIDPKLLEYLIESKNFPSITNEATANAFIINHLTENNGQNSAFITPYEKGKKTWVISSLENQKKSIVSGLFSSQEGGKSASVAISHEILHAILDRTFSKKQVKDLSKQLLTYLEEGEGPVENRNISKGTIGRIKTRLLNAEKTHGKDSDAYAQEVFTSFSDEMGINNISWERADKKFWQKFADSMTDYFQYWLGIDHEIINTSDIRTGEQAFNFLKTYNRTFLGNNKVRVSGQGTNSSGSGSTIRNSATINDMANRIMGGPDTLTDKSMSKAEWDALSDRVIARIYPTLDNLIGAKITSSLRALPNFSQEDFIAETKIELIPHIRNFDPSKNDNLAAWINSQVNNKINNVLGSGRATTEKFTNELNESNTGSLLDEEVYSEEQEKTWFELLDIKEDNPIYKDIADKTISALGSKLPEINQIEFKKKLQQAFESMLYDIIYTDVFNHQKGKRGPQNLESFTTFLEINGESIYNKMSKEVINNNYQTFMINLGRGNVALSDKNPKVKSRTAGNLITEKEEYNSDKFVDYFTKNLSRKESLAKTLSKELGFDATIDVLENNKEARARFAGVQSLMNNDNLENQAAALGKALDRATPNLRNSATINNSYVELANSLGLFVDDLNNISEENLIVGVENLNVTPINKGFTTKLKALFPDMDTKLIDEHFYKNDKGKKIIIDYKLDDDNLLEQLIYKKRYIVDSSELLNQLENFEQNIALFIPAYQIQSSLDVENQNSNWFKKMVEMNLGSARGIVGAPVAAVDSNGRPLSKADQINMTDEQFNEAVEISKAYLNNQRNIALKEALAADTKASEETIAAWAKVDINKIELGNKGAAKIGHILNIYREIANSEITAQEKIKELRKRLGKDGIAAIEMGKLLLEAYALSVNDLVNDKVANGMTKVDAIKFVATNFQKTTNAVFSARAYAAFSSFQFTDGPQNIDDKFTGIKGEHVDDASTVTFNIVESIYEGTIKQDISKILNNFEQSAIEKRVADLFDKLGGRNSPLGNLRFLLAPKESKEIWDLKTGKNMYDVALAELKTMLKQEMGFEVPLTPNLRNSSTINKIRVFDFDDTLAQSNSQVLYALPNGKTGKLNATQFAAKSAALEDKGAVFDFTEFNEVIDGKKGPLFEVAQAIQDKKGTENVFVLTARPQKAAKAIKTFLDGVGLNIPLSNITGLEDGKAEAKAKWIEEKITEGYNDFYFADDAKKNVKAVQDLLNTYDVKGVTQLAKLRNSATLNQNFNQILFDVSKIPADEIFSEKRALKTDAIIKQNKVFLPPTAEDFTGLLYQFLSEGKKGEEQLAWFKANLLDPFGKGINAINVNSLRTKNNYNALKKQFPEMFPFIGKNKINKKTDYSGFTYGDASRVYMWNKAGYDIPGLSKQDIDTLVDIVENDQMLKDFSDNVYGLTQEGYVTPDESWEVGTIESDLQSASTSTNRAAYLAEFIKNSEEMFGQLNGQGKLVGNTANKIQAIYGSDFLDSLSDILYRMKTGRHRTFGTNKMVNGFMNWINNSVATIMFINTRSAVLQGISMINYINWSDNNPVKAAIAFANQPQYWADFARIFNSDFLKSRRTGNKFDVSADEIAAFVKGKGNKMKAALNYALRKGFILTQMMDSFAIATGGASFFRNRTDVYIQQGFELAEAEEKAMFDFMEITEESQQSSRPDRISTEQAGPLGRTILAFANTPLQYNRLMKKAYLDLKNGRGDAKTNISKIAYYALAQNFIFNALQQALFGLLWEEEPEDEEQELADKDMRKEKSIGILNGMADSLLRGSGVYGAAGATLKNILMEIRRQNKKKRPDYTSVAMQTLSISPPVRSKMQKLRSAAKTVEYNMDEIKALGLDIDNPAILATAQVSSALLNLPLDRLVKKVDNIRTSMEDNTKTWQQISLMAGWDQYSLGINPYILPEEKKAIVDEYKRLQKENKKDSKTKTKKKGTKIQFTLP